MLNLKRILIDLILISGIFWLPWIVAAFFAIALSWFYCYYEIIFIGFLFDIFYNSDLYVHVGRHFISYPFTLAAFAVFIIFRMLKKQTRFHS